MTAEKKVMSRHLTRKRAHTEASMYAQSAQQGRMSSGWAKLSFKVEKSFLHWKVVCR